MSAYEVAYSIGGNRHTRAFDTRLEVDAFKLTLAPSCRDVTVTVFGTAAVEIDVR